MSRSSCGTAPWPERTSRWSPPAAAPCRLGFALQLCVARVTPVARLAVGRGDPGGGADLCRGADRGRRGPRSRDLCHAARDAPRASGRASREAFGFSFLGLEHRRTLLDWLLPVAARHDERVRPGPHLMDEPQWRRIVVVGPSTVERLVAKALLEAERHVAGQLDLWPRPRTEGRPRRAPRAAPRGPASQCPELGAPAAGGREPPLDDAPRESTSAPAECGPRPGERRRRPRPVACASSPERGAA